MKILKDLSNFLETGKPLAMVVSVTLSVLFLTGLVEAASTISTNITTDGKITGNYASSTVLSVNNTAYFGGTASTTIDVAGNIVGPGTLAITGASTFTGAVTAIGNSNSGRASTTVFSVNNTAFFGGTATSTFSSAGALSTPSVAATGAITSSSASAGIGYATGAGCAVTQATNRTTGVTCTGVSGAITTNTASLAAEGTAKFTVTNTSVALGDVVVVSQRSGSDGGGTLVEVTTVAAGSFQIAVHNGNVAAGTAETGAIVINFVVIKAVQS